MVELISPPPSSSPLRFHVLWSPPAPHGGLDRKQKTEHPPLTLDQTQLICAQLDERYLSGVLMGCFSAALSHLRSLAALSFHHSAT